MRKQRKGLVFAGNDPRNSARAFLVLLLSAIVIGLIVWFLLAPPPEY